MWLTQGHIASKLQSKATIPEFLSKALALIFYDNLKGTAKLSKEKYNLIRI